MERLRVDAEIELAYWVTGDESAPAVVFTHGGSMDHRMWDPQVAVLGDQFRVVAHDVRGHGISPCAPERFTLRDAAADLLAILDAAGIERAVFVGHSLGGTVAQIAALEQPQRLRGFVGIGCACVTMPPSTRMRVFSAIAAPAARRLGPARIRDDTVRRAGVRRQTRAYARETVACLDDAMLARTASVGFNEFREVPGYHVGVPLLLLQGAKDGYRPLLSSAATWAQRDGGQYVVVPDAGHNAGQDNAPFVNARLLDFLGVAAAG